MLTPPPAASPRPRSYVLSLALHIALLGVSVGLLRHAAPRLALNQMPGTALGNTTLVYYSPGGPPRTAAQTHKRPKPSTKPLDTPVLSAPRAEAETADRSADNGTGDSAESGLGNGDLRIALPAFFPTPKPNLASMPAGTAGDVILDATIDEHGAITQLTVLKGLTEEINRQVIATVQQWTYTPAMRDGTPVASGQELHFHFERGSAG